MSFATIEATIESALTGYTRVTENFDSKQAPHTRKNGSYILRSVGLDTSQLTSSGIVYCYMVSLEFLFSNKNNSERDANADDFEAACNIIYALSDFAGVKEDPVISDVDNKFSIGKLVFYFGIATS